MTAERQRLGVDAETAVARWLSGGGWQILARRWRCAVGELDIVALDPLGTLVGVEVKARRSTHAGSPAEAVDERRVMRLRAALAMYARGHASAMALRIDLVTLQPDTDRAGSRWRATRLEAIDAW